MKKWPLYCVNGWAWSAFLGTAVYCFFAFTWCSRVKMSRSLQTKLSMSGCTCYSLKVNVVQSCIGFFFCTVSIFNTCFLTILYRCYTFRRHLRHLRGAPHPDLKLEFLCTKSAYLGAINQQFNPIRMHGLSYVKIICQYCPLFCNIILFFNIVQHFPLLSNIFQYCPIRYSIVQCFITTVIYLTTLSFATIADYR